MHVINMLFRLFNLKLLMQCLLPRFIKISGTSLLSVLAPLHHITLIKKKKRRKSFSSIEEAHEACSNNGKCFMAVGGGLLVGGQADHPKSGSTSSIVATR